MRFAVLVCFLVGEAVDGSFVVVELEVDFCFLHRFFELGDLLGTDEGVVGSIADEYFCSGFFGVHWFLESECTVEAGDAIESFQAVVGHLHGDVSAETVSDGSEVFIVRGALCFEEIHRGFETSDHFGLVLFHGRSEAAGVFGVFGGLAFAIHVDGERGVAQFGEFFGALARVVVCTPPFVDDEDAGVWSFFCGDREEAFGGDFSGGVADFFGDDFSSVGNGGKKRDEGEEFQHELRLAAYESLATPSWCENCSPS